MFSESAPYSFWFSIFYIALRIIDRNSLQYNNMKMSDRPPYFCQSLPNRNLAEISALLRKVALDLSRVANVSTARKNLKHFNLNFDHGANFHLRAGPRSASSNQTRASNSVNVIATWTVQIDILSAVMTLIGQTHCTKACCNARILMQQIWTLESKSHGAKIDGQD
jgi:hypothetical protein